MGHYYNPEGLWVMVDSSDYPNVSNTTLADYYKAGITGVVLDVTTASERTSYSNVAASVLSNNLGIAAWAAPFASSDFTTFWNDIHTWQNGLHTAQHPAFYIHDIENWEITGAGCWTTSLLESCVSQFKTTFPLYASNDSFGCTSYGDTQYTQEGTCSEVFPWKTIVDEYPFYVPQIYNWTGQGSGGGCTPYSTSQILTWWEQDSGNSISSYEWRFATGTGTYSTVNGGTIYPVLGAYDSSYASYCVDIIQRASSCPGFLFWRYTYATSSGVCTYYSTSVPNPVITKTLSALG